MKITQQDAPRLYDVAPQLPRPLTVLLGRMLALRPEDRYQDVRVILEDVQSYERRGLLTVAPGGSLPEIPLQPEGRRELTRPIPFQPLPE